MLYRDIDPGEEEVLCLVSCLSIDLELGPPGWRSFTDEARLPVLYIAQDPTIKVRLVGDRP